jgi:hypothetical protein
MKKSIVFVNQSSGYLMIDIINEHVPYYDDIILLTGYINPRDTPLNEKVKLIKLLNYNRTSSINRFMTWTGFWVQSLYYIFIKYKKSNLYFVSNPPLNAFSARFTKRDFAFLIYDIFPGAFEKFNIMKSNTLLYKYWEQTNKIIYNKAKILYTLSDDMKLAMNADESDNHKIKIVPVWTRNSFFKNITKSENLFLKKYNLNNKFIVCYSGNLGKTHPVEKLIDLAAKLVSYEDIFFLIIGDGDKKKQLLKTQQTKVLPNLKILDFQPTELFPHVLAAVDIGVVTLESDAGDVSVPSKTYNLMSAGKPILSIAKHSSELAHIINKYKIGQSYTENQLDEMCDFILKLKLNQKEYNLMKAASKKASLDFTPKNAKQMILK